MLYSFGSNNYGQCGVGKDKGDKIKTPTRIQLPSVAVYVSCGYNHTLVILKCGSIYSFGCGAWGQLGHGTNENIYTPKPILALKDKKIIKCAGGGHHSVCVDVDGIVWTFGHGEYGQLGHSN